MSDVYGIDPAAPRIPDDIIWLKSVFAASRGRFIADFPLDWVSEVSQRVQAWDMGDVERTRVQAALRQLQKHALLPTPVAPFQNNQPWAENAARQQGGLG